MKLVNKEPAVLSNVIDTDGITQHIRSDWSHGCNTLKIPQTPRFNTLPTHTTFVAILLTKETRFLPEPLGTFSFAIQGNIFNYIITGGKMPSVLLDPLPMATEHYILPYFPFLRKITGL
jgi:hypothetical protein